MWRAGSGTFVHHLFYKKPCYEQFCVMDILYNDEQYDCFRLICDESTTCVPIGLHRLLRGQQKTVEQFCLALLMNSGEEKLKDYGDLLQQWKDLKENAPTKYQGCKVMRNVLHKRITVESAVFFKDLKEQPIKLVAEHAFNLFQSIPREKAVPFLVVLLKFCHWPKTLENKIEEEEEEDIGLLIYKKALRKDRELKEYRLYDTLKGCAIGIIEYMTAMDFKYCCTIEAKKRKHDKNETLITSMHDMICHWIQWLKDNNKDFKSVQNICLDSKNETISRAKQFLKYFLFYFFNNDREVNVTEKRYKAEDILNEQKNRCIVIKQISP